MRNITGFILIGAIIGGFSGCAARGASVLSLSDVKILATYYTTANIWYEDPEVIRAMNYHKGAMIPAGTQVKIISHSERHIEFSDDEAAYKLFYSPEYSNIGIGEYFQRYFSSKDPMAEDGVYSSFTELEKENIEAGEVAIGMSKKAVLMAYGYPPTHRTSSIDNNIWIYWVSRVRKSIVYFRKGKVVNVEDKFGP